MARRRAVVLAYLPNKKILFFLIFILLIFAGWFYFSGYKNKQAQDIAEKEKSPLAVVTDQTNQLDKDSDADGLKDWEELLWKTDPNKADTDSDGTNDNEEITLNRNPLKAGPDDKISEKEDLVAQEKSRFGQQSKHSNRRLRQTIFNGIFVAQTAKRRIDRRRQKQFGGKAYE